MRISDWSSDVCSSDLHADRQTAPLRRTPVFAVTIGGAMDRAQRERQQCRNVGRHARRTGQTEQRTATDAERSEEHTSELQSLMRISYAVFCLKKKHQPHKIQNTNL